MLQLPEPALSFLNSDGRRMGLRLAGVRSALAALTPYSLIILASVPGRGASAATPTDLTMEISAVSFFSGPGSLSATIYPALILLFGHTLT